MVPGGRGPADGSTCKSPCGTGYSGGWPNRFACGAGADGYIYKVPVGIGRPDECANRRGGAGGGVCGNRRGGAGADGSANETPFCRGLVGGCTYILDDGPGRGRKNGEEAGGAGRARGPENEEAGGAGGAGVYMDEDTIAGRENEDAGRGGQTGEASGDAECVDGREEEGADGAG